MQKSLDQQAEHTETIRIPISEERIEITKHPTALEDISIYKKIRLRKLFRLMRP
ncbi:hypothetical protein GCM10020331_020620 [Ectobacillus funiculus]